MIRRPPRSTQSRSSAASDVYKRQDPDSGRKRLVWFMVIVLSYSRHCFVWPMFRQQLSDVIEGLEAGWTFFGGISRYLIIDNFPAAVAGMDPLNPRLTRGFLEYVQW